MTAASGGPSWRSRYDLAVRDVSVREEVGLEASDRHFLEAGFETHDLATSARWNLIDRAEHQRGERLQRARRDRPAFSARFDARIDARGRVAHRPRSGGDVADNRARPAPRLEQRDRRDDCVAARLGNRRRAPHRAPARGHGALHAKPGLREVAAGRLLRQSHVADADGARERARGARARRGRARPRRRPALRASRATTSRTTACSSAGSRRPGSGMCGSRCRSTRRSWQSNVPAPPRITSFPTNNGRGTLLRLRHLRGRPRNDADRSVHGLGILRVGPRRRGGPTAAGTRSITTAATRSAPSGRSGWPPRSTSARPCASPRASPTRRSRGSVSRRRK